MLKSYTITSRLSVTLRLRSGFMSGTDPGRSSPAQSDSDASPPTKKLKRIFDFRRYAKRHVALKVAYLGMRYDGFAIQDTTSHTIEGRLFAALEKVKLVEDTRNCNYTRCGRTDAGVSALGQVSMFSPRVLSAQDILSTTKLATCNLLEGEGVELASDCTASERKGDKLEELPYMKMLNSTLPEDIRILAWAPVRHDFSARFNCLHRTYKYFFPKGNMDIDVMRSAAQKFVGDHDFRNFCRMDIKGGVKNFRRKILSVDINEVTDGESPYQQCEITIVGLAFLWHQIRCMVGILFLIGHGLESSEVIDHMLDIEKCPNKPQYGMASELPLILYGSAYEGLQWRRDEQNYVKVVSHFQRMWADLMVKNMMLRRILDSLELSLFPSPPPISQVAPLIKSDHRLGGAYKPLLSRPTGATLEERFDHFKQKRLREKTTIPDKS